MDILKKNKGQKIVSHHPINFLKIIDGDRTNIFS
jgi:hypothetical protein